MKPDDLADLRIDSLGPCRIDSPLLSLSSHFVEDEERIAVYSHSADIEACEALGVAQPMFERAGPRRKIFFDPAKLSCGVVTCGGLCPGLNDVIRTVTMGLAVQYGVKNVFGFKYGYLGMSSNAPEKPIRLTPELVDDIHLKGGDILSSSRGHQDFDDMIDTLELMGINLLFVIGGDGTLRGSQGLVNVIKKRNLDIGVVGIPKTIDNDISGIERSFGFSTAVEAARVAVNGAHEEARGAWNGVGLVKLMGRDSGFIAATATLANSVVNFCFIPEVPLVLDGQKGFLASLERRLDRKHHALIVVAEGAGRELTESSDSARDASGNIIREDIGLLLKKRITDYFKQKNKPLALKYIDPSYIIRSLPADSNDSAFCVLLGQNAVHAGMAGRTNMVVGFWNQYFVHVPTAIAVHERKKIDPSGHLWQTILETTGQARI